MILVHAAAARNTSAVASIGKWNLAYCGPRLLFVPTADRLGRHPKPFTERAVPSAMAEWFLRVELSRSVTAIRMAALGTEEPVDVTQMVVGVLGRS
jgi:hypothetical protein